MSDAELMTAVMILHLPGLLLLFWVMRNLRDNDPSDGSGGGGRRVPAAPPPGYRWQPRRSSRRPSPRPRRGARRALRAAR